MTTQAGVSAIMPVPVSVRPLDDSTGAPSPTSQSVDLSWIASSSAAQHDDRVNKDTSLALDVRAPSPATLALHSKRHSDAGLRISTPVTPGSTQPEDLFPPPSYKNRPSPLISRPSWKSSTSWDSTVGAPSPSWSMSSPALASLSDVTPLPSPLVLSQSPEFRRFLGRVNTSSNTSLYSSAREEVANVLASQALSTSPGKRKKAYTGLGISHSANNHNNSTTNGHARDRSLSEYIPEHLLNTRLRNVTAPVDIAEILQRNQQNELGNIPEGQMHREEFVSKQRGYASSSPEAPAYKTFSPPESLASISDEEDFPMTEVDDVEKLVIQRMTFRVQRKLGHGAFSEVVLASHMDDYSPQDSVAIKIVNHKLAQGSDEERMGTSITREIAILQDLSHPCLPKLIAFENTPERALLAMLYCPGGDLFELASQQRELLTPLVIQRIFSELVEAVGYLHSNYIVHRDIKLENVLFNIPPSHLPSLPSPLTHPTPLITLTDLGLSKHIPPPPSSPLLTHACGSPDYVAPELLLGQPYDGRLTDAWALGVLLYAIMEGRLPFDPLPVRPGMTAAELKRRGVGGSVKHRIARCNWLWCEWGDDEGVWIGDKRAEGGVSGGEGEALEGGRVCVEGLLKKVTRGRWDVGRLKEVQWVRLGIQVEAGRDQGRSPRVG